MDVVSRLEPQSILDVGSGFGRWGFLSRCHLAMGHSLVSNPDQGLRIEAIEVFKPNISPIYDAVYNKTYNKNALEVMPDLGKYDVIICGDMIEHLEKGNAWRLIKEMRQHASGAVILTLPFGNCPQDEMYGNKHETHLSTWNKRDFLGKEYFVKRFLFKRNIIIGVVVIPLSMQAKWLIKTMRNPLRLFIQKRFYGILRKLHR